MSKRSRGCVLIIGDEVLSAKIEEANASFLLSRLRGVGAEVRELRVVSDAVEDIAQSLTDLLAKGDWVITTGGVGPTHDDRTLDGVARALNLPIEAHEGILKLLEKRFPDQLPPGMERLARAPRGATLLATECFFPVVQVGRVTVLPGVPSLVQEQFPRIEGRFAGSPPICGALFCTARETAIAAVLEQMDSSFPQVSLGSYPRYQAQGFRVILTVEATDPEQLGPALDALAEALPQDSVVARELPFLGIRDSLPS